MRTRWSISLSLWTLLFATTVAEAADLRFAHGLYRDKRYQLAADEYKSFLAANPGDPKADEARYFLAESLFQLQRHDEAAAAYAQVGPSEKAYRKEALFRAGTIFKRAGHAAKAREALERFTSEFPDAEQAPGAWLLLAELSLAEKKLSDAEQAVRKARPNVEDGSRWRGRLQLVDAELRRAAGRGREAVVLLNALAASKDPLAAEASIRLGISLFSDRKFAEAAAFFDRTAALTNDAQVVRRANYNAGLCHVETKNWPEAERRLRPVFEASVPEGDAEAEGVTARAGQALVQARLGAGDRAGARAVVEDGLRRFGNSASAWEFKRLSAEVDLLDGRASEAATTLKSLLLDAQDDADRDALLVLACRTAAATSDAAWGGNLLRNFPPEAKEATRDQAERALAEAEWKDGLAVEGLLAQVRDPLARARLNYRSAAIALEASEPAKAVERLNAVRAMANLPDDLRSNVDFVLGGALVQLERWSEALAPLEDYLRAASGGGSRFDERSLAAAGRWWARCLTWLSDADAQRRMEPFLASAHRPLFEAIATSFAGERRSELALWLLGKLPAPESRTAAVIAARCLVESKRPQEALQKIPAPAMPEEKYLVGTAMLQLNRPESAAQGRSLLRQVADAEPPTPWSLDAALRLARLAKGTSEVGDAERRLARLASSAKGPDQRRLRLETAFLAAESGRALQAIADLRAFIEEEKSTPEAVEAALKLAELHESRGEASQSDAALATAERLDAGQQASGSLLFRRASLAYRAKDWAKAESLLSEYLQRFAKDESAGAAALMHAEVALEQGKAEDAVGRFTALKANSDPTTRSAAALRLAQALTVARRHEEAERVAAEVLASPGQPAGRAAEAHFIRGRALMSRAQFAEARAAFERAAVDEASEMAAKARFMVGETYFHQRKFDAAMKEYLRLAVLGRHDEWCAAALLQVGKCHEHLGDSVAAAEDYQRVLDRYPSSPAAKQAKDRLQQVQLGARNRGGTA